MKRWLDNLLLIALWIPTLICGGIFVGAVVWAVFSWVMEITEPQSTMNWTLIIIAAIGALSAIVTGILGVVGRRDIKNSLHELKIEVDGKLTALVAAKEDAADAKGQLKGRDHLSDAPNTTDPLKVEVTNLDPKEKI